MECDVSLMDEMLDDADDGEEDWNDTTWADPNVAGGGNEAGRKKHLDYFPGKNDDNLMKNNTFEVRENTEDAKVVKRMLLNDNKAGMTGLDKERINRIIHEASKGSKFYENEKQKEEQMKKRIEEQREKIQHISPEQLTQGTVEADRLLEDFEQQRDLSRCIVHIDMDAFYAAVEMRDDPSLFDKPMAVGGSDMLSTSNYPARKYGVRAAMPGFIAKKLCPDLVIVPSNFDKYTAVSKDIKTVMAEFDPNFCPMSLDEAYLDLTEHLLKRQNMTVEERTVICRDSDYAFSRAHCVCDLNSVAQYHNLHEYSKHSEAGDSSIQSKRANCTTANFSENSGKGENSVCPECHKTLPPFKYQIFGLTDEDAVMELRMKIQQRTRLTASAGIAPNMMLAKVCSDKNKPNGQYKIPFTTNDVMNFLRDLPTRKISGIGKVSEAMLNAIDVHTCTDLYNKRGLLYHLYSTISFNYFMRICLGIGSTTVERDSERKSMSTERTFSEISKPSELFKKLEELSVSLSEDLKEEQLKGKTVSIKIKTVNFQVRTKAHTVRDYTNDYDDILQSATGLLKAEIQHSAPHPLRLRLMGVRMSNLMPENLCRKQRQNTIIGAFQKLTKTKKDVEEGTGSSGKTLDETIKLGKTEVEVHKDLVGDVENCSKRTDEYKANINEENDINKPNDIGDVYDNACVTSATVDEREKLPEHTGVTKVSNSSENKISVDFHSKFTDSACHNRAEEHAIYIDSANAVKRSSEVNLVIPEHKKHHLTCNAEIFDSVTSVAEEEDQNEAIIVGTSSEVDTSKIEAPIKDCKMELLVSTPVIVHGARVTRSGLVGSSVSGNKGRKKSSKLKTSIQYECPVCNNAVLCKNLQGFNEHVDMCLESGPTIELRSDVQTDSVGSPQDKLEDTSGEKENPLHERESAIESKHDEKNLVEPKSKREEKLPEKSLAEQSSGLASEINNGNEEIENSRDLNPGKTDTGLNDIHKIDQEFSCSLIGESSNQLISAKDGPAVVEVEHSKVDAVTADSNSLMHCSGDVNKTNQNQPLKRLEMNYCSKVCINTSMNCDNVCDNFLVIPPPDDGKDFDVSTDDNHGAYDGAVDVKDTIADDENVLDEDDTGSSNDSGFGTILPDTTTAAQEYEPVHHESENQLNVDKGTPIDPLPSGSGLSEHFDQPAYSVSSVSTNSVSFFQLDDGYKFNQIEENDEDTSAEAGTLLICPVCNIGQLSADLHEFNEHVDACLSRGAITELVKEQNKKDTSLKRTMQTPGNTKPAKKRKTVLPDLPSKSCRSIASFFKTK